MVGTFYDNLDGKDKDGKTLVRNLTCCNMISWVLSGDWWNNFVTLCFNFSLRTAEKILTFFLTFLILPVLWSSPHQQ